MIRKLYSLEPHLDIIFVFKITFAGSGKNAIFASLLNKRRRTLSPESSGEGSFIH